MKLDGQTLLVRADAGTRMGGGHLMRCLALAQAWQGEGGRAFFLSHCESEQWIRLLHEAGVGFVPLETPHPDPADLQRTLAGLREMRANWLVLDGYHFPPTYQEAVRRAGYPLLVIDDTAHWPAYHASILVNQNIHAGQLTYVCDPDTLLLLGTRYALLRPEFQAWAGWSRDLPHVARKVLVTLGGGDPDNVTLKVMRALRQVDVPGLEVKVVVGPANPHLQTLQEAARNAGSLLHVVTNGTSMPGLMAWADVAVAAGGSTCWELAFMGLPSLVLVLAENQIRIAQGLERVGAVLNLGWWERVSDSELGESLTRLLHTPQVRRAASEVGRTLVDGDGARRVVRAMAGRTHTEVRAPLEVRLATMRDALALWQLANDPGVRMNSFKPEPIPLNRHMDWFQGKLSSGDSRIWVLEVDGDVVAQVRYERIDTLTAEVHFAVVSAFRGKGYGTQGLVLTGLLACEALDVKRLRAVVFDTNPPSARAFEKAGYRHVASQPLRGRPCLIFERDCPEGGKCQTVRPATAP